MDYPCIPFFYVTASMCKLGFSPTSPAFCPIRGWWKGDRFEEYIEDMSLNHTFFFLVLYGLHQWWDGRFVSILVY
jgi:hypothetical protein